MSNPTRPRYVMPTGVSLLSNKVLEMMNAHTSGKDYKYDHYPLVPLSIILKDQNSVFLTQASEGGKLGDKEELL